MNLVRLVVLLPCFVVLVMPPLAGGAADPQNTMKVCNEQANAGGLGEGKGEERQAFLQKCLSAKPAKTRKTAQQEKMKTCNKDAGEKQLAGEERKKFMSTCLSG